MFFYSICIKKLQIDKKKRRPNNELKKGDKHTKRHTDRVTSRQTDTQQKK